MARFQFTIPALLGSIALVATGLAAMLDRSESRWLEPVFLTVVLALVVFASMSAIFRRGPAQAFWGGFVIVALAYLALVGSWMAQGEQYGRGALATSRVLKRIEQYVQQRSATITATVPIATYPYPWAPSYSTPAPVYAPPVTVAPPSIAPPPVVAYPSVDSAPSPPGTAPSDVSEPANAVQAPSSTPPTAVFPSPGDPTAGPTFRSALAPRPAASPSPTYYAPAPTVIYTTVAAATPAIDHEAFMRCGQVLWAMAIGGAAGLLARRFYRARHCEAPAQEKIA